MDLFVLEDPDGNGGFLKPFFALPTALAVGAVGEILPLTDSGEDIAVGLEV